MDKSEEPISISDFSDYEKHWIIECSFDSENNLIIQRKNKGYTATELIGLCEITLHRIIDSVELNAKHVRQLVTKQ